VAGEVIKGPTDKFMRAVGEEPTAAGVAAAYQGLIDGLVVDSGDPDPPPESVPTLVIPTLMDDAASRREVAERTLEFARSLAR
jgi:LPPG:FO 2-phospho-L-lactate transferase